MRRRIVDQLLAMLRRLLAARRQRRTRDRGTGGGVDAPQRDSRPPKARPARPEQPKRPKRPKPSSGDAGAHDAPSTNTHLGDGHDRFEYSPDLDGHADPGEVVWTWVPFEEDPSQGKDRPVLIVGRRDDRLLGVALTSKHHPDEPQVSVGSGRWDGEGRTSYARIDRVLEVDPEQVRREGDILDRHRFDDVVAALRRVNNW